MSDDLYTLELILTTTRQKGYFPFPSYRGGTRWYTGRKWKLADSLPLR